MKSCIRHGILIVGVSLLSLLLLTTPALAAGPRIMMVYGRPLDTP